MVSPSGLAQYSFPSDEAGKGKYRHFSRFEIFPQFALLPVICLCEADDLAYPAYTCSMWMVNIPHYTNATQLLALHKVNMVTLIFVYVCVCVRVFAVSLCFSCIGKL